MPKRQKPVRVVIMGAAGRDFHNFNMVYRGDPGYDVIAFTAAQIPDIADRKYPRELAGPGYPTGIPIVRESELGELCRKERVDEVIFAYSDVCHETVMHHASLVLASGPDFLLLGPARTMLQASIPVIAVSAVRTGCGKSQTARWLSRLLQQRGLRVSVIRHPMPYGDLAKQAVQRFASREDIDAADCTVEEREEYEPHVELGNIIYAGIDYAEIIARASAEAEILLWDGGNNDFPFVTPDLHIVLVDPLRPDTVLSHHPGEAVLRMADVIVVAKANSASDADIRRTTENARKLNPTAPIVHGASPVHLEDPEAVRGRRVLVIEDGPTITHGGMAYGAGLVAATEAEAAEIVDPRASATVEIAAVYTQYPHIGSVLPAVGYGPAQLSALRDTINASDADVVVSATPCDLTRLMDIEKPVVRARYEFAEVADPGLGSLVDAFLAEQKLGSI